MILERDDWEMWLDPGMKDTAVVSELLRPFDARAMRCDPVSGRVNQVQNDDEECCKHEVAEAPQVELFWVR